MRSLTYSVILLCIFSLQATGQTKLSGHLNTGFLFPFNDFTDNSFQGVKPNGFVGAGLGYVLAENFRLRGDLNAGILNGDNNVHFYETTFFEGHLFGEYNIIPLMNSDSKFELNINAGLGLNLYYAKRFDVTTRTRITESPIPSNSSFSTNPIVSAGFSISYPLSPNLAVNLGYTQKAMLFNDNMDTFESGSSDDFYGGLNMGLIFSLKKVKDKSKVEIDRKKYNKLISSIDSLDNIARNGNPEKMARLEMESQEKDLKIRALEVVIDSLKTNVVSIDSEKPASGPKADPATILATPQYRIIVGSMPSRERATRWIARSGLDDSEMVVVYVDDIDTYRIVYKSYNSYAAARKELLQIRGRVPDAWIIKF